MNYLFTLLFFLPNVQLNALPIAETKSSTLNSAQKAMLSEYKIDQLAPALRLSQVIPKFKKPKNFNLTQIEKELKDFGIHSLKDDKHLEGIPLERDGKVNVDFHKEIFLGNHEAFESEIDHDKTQRNDKLKEIFHQADINHDESLSKEELLNHVLKNVEEHLREAKERNSQLFILIDSNQDGKVTWHEYFALYVKFHRVNDTLLKGLDNFEFLQGPFDSDFQRELVKIRYRWNEADKAEDNELDIDEFLGFRHPEIAGESYRHVVDDMMLRMDRDEDQKLNETEFVVVPASVLEDPNNKAWVEMDKKWLQEQKDEFLEIDENHDGMLSKEELMKAFDPRNRLHINTEIKKLFAKVDTSPQDEKLSLQEIQQHADVFTDMRILDTERALHDEI